MSTSANTSASSNCQCTTCSGSSSCQSTSCNCPNTCPKGLNPAKAIAEIKKMIVERSS